jgi:hypothetical protein
MRIFGDRRLHHHQYPSVHLQLHRLAAFFWDCLSEMVEAATTNATSHAAMSMKWNSFRVNSMYISFRVHR